MKKENKEDKIELAEIKSATVTRAHEFKNGHVSFDAVLDDCIKVYGMVFIEGKKGDFISMPSYKGSDDNYYNYVYFEYDDKFVADIKAQLEKLI